MIDKYSINFEKINFPSYNITLQYRHNIAPVINVDSEHANKTNFTRVHEKLF
jgi:hypothetical protein